MSAPRKGFSPKDLDGTPRRAAAEEGRHVVTETDDPAIVLMLVALIAARQLGDVARQRLVHCVGIHRDRRIGRAFLGRRRTLFRCWTGRLALRLAMLFRLAVFLGLVMLR